MRIAPHSWSNLTSWRIMLSVWSAPRAWSRFKANCTRCSSSDNPSTNIRCTSWLVELGIEPAAEALRRFEGVGDNPSGMAVAVGAALRSMPATGRHFHRNQEAGIPTSKCGAHSADRALIAASRCPLSCLINGLGKPQRSGRRSFSSRMSTRSSISVGRKACKCRIEKRDLIRFSSRSITSIFSEVPMMESRTPASCAMSKRL
mmetsp:Transcript_8341/g.21206  ORF Transcript_8341/g.21206 Transcript_8341/m.21206 type:complete len:203 (+) Transcript_8341:482-1090(+)